MENIKEHKCSNPTRDRIETQTTLPCSSLMYMYLLTFINYNVTSVLEFLSHISSLDRNLNSWGRQK